MNDDEYLMIAMFESGVRSNVSQDRNRRDDVADCCWSNFRTRKAAIPVECIKSILKALQFSGELDVLEVGRSTRWIYALVG